MVGVFQPWHLIVVLVITVMVFGPGKLPELGKAIGDGFRELKRATNGHDEPTRLAAAPAHAVALAECAMCGAGLPQTELYCGACGSPPKQAA
jgi:sec-independent protein translocase protein TatA